MTYALYWVREPLAPALAAVMLYRALQLPADRDSGADRQPAVELDHRADQVVPRPAAAAQAPHLEVRLQPCVKPELTLYLRFFQRVRATFLSVRLTVAIVAPICAVLVAACGGSNVPPPPKVVAEVSSTPGQSSTAAGTSGHGASLRLGQSVSFAGDQIVGSGKGSRSL